MASSSEGSREIEAAKKRLAAAKERASADAKALKSARDAEASARKMAKSTREAEVSARKMAEMAKKNSDAAMKHRGDIESQLKGSREEVKEAETFLKGAEKRWEVVAIDDSDVDESEEGGSRKKQKTSASDRVDEITKGAEFQLLMECTLYPLVASIESHRTSRRPLPTLPITHHTSHITPQRFRYQDGISSSEGAREIEAAKKRLAAAKERASADAEALELAREVEASARKTAEMAKKNASSANRKASAAAKALELAKRDEESAKTMAAMADKNAGVATRNKAQIQSQLQGSKKEVQKAEKFLKAAEERWEVVAIDDSDAEESEEGGSRKKQKKSHVVDEITVEGCGIPGANGVYEVSGEKMFGCVIYEKEGELEGRAGKYTIYSYPSSNWCVSHRAYGSTFHPRVVVYLSGRHKDELPPKEGWKSWRVVVGGFVHFAEEQGYFLGGRIWWYLQ